MDLLIAIALVGLTAALFLAWAVMARRPGLWAGFFRPRTWVRVGAWALVLTVAGIAGVALGGGNDRVSETVLVSGGIVLLISFEGWMLARTFGTPG
jgi:hypothetical protein